jgi:hypothetical protein
MGLLDGSVARLFAGVFGTFFPDAILHPRERTEIKGGSATAIYGGLAGQPGGIAAKVQRDKVTYAMRETEGYAPGDVAFLILSQLDGVGLPEPQPGWRMTWPAKGGALYSIEAPIDLDAAGSHWLARGRPVKVRA